MKTKLTKLFTLALVMLAAASCLSDGWFDGAQQPGHGDGTVRFTLAVPNAATAKPSTRGMTAAQEEAVSDVDVLVFYTTGPDAAKLYRREKGVPAVNPTTGTSIPNTYEVKLPMGTFDLMVLANARDIVDDAALANASTTWGQASTMLTTSLAEGTKWTDEPIPMFGYKSGVTVNESTELTGDDAIDMHRMLAKIDVMLSDEAAGTDNGNFALTEIYLCNYNTVGCVVPALSNLGPDDNGINPDSEQAIAPTIPTGAAVTPGIGTSAAPSPALLYTTADGLAPSLVENTIYTFEAATAGASAADDPELNPCIVVGGSYQGGATTYYRVDFVKGSDDDVEWLSLLRNHRYIVMVKKVVGGGFATPEEAYRGNSFNIEVGVLEWEDGGPIHTEFIGDKYFSIAREHEFEPWKDLVHVFHIETSLDDFAVEWGGTKCLATDGETSYTSEHYRYDLAENGTDKWTLTATTLGHNVTTTEDDNEDSPHIVSGGMDLAMRVTQRWEAAIALPAPPVVSADKSPYILHWDGAQLQVGRWNEGVNQANILFFKFGSLVGTAMISASDSYNAADVKFNPTPTPSFPAWEDIPVYDNYPAAIDTDPDDRLAGKGDPCKLVGLTPAQARNLAVQGKLDDYDSGFRLPTNVENAMSGYNTIVGTSGRYDFGVRVGDNAATFLPAAGGRSAAGLVTNRNKNGFYWSATPNSDATGYSLYFGGAVSPSSEYNYSCGLGVRCLPNDWTPLPLSTEPYILYFLPDGTLWAGNFDNNTVRVDNMAFFKFGSVIGFDNNKVGDPNTGSTAWPADGSAIRFNPTKLVYGTQITAYAPTDYNAAASNAQPNIPGYVSGDYPKFVLAADYATVANLRAGKGDPCKLIGYTGAQLQAMNDSELQSVLDNAAYRLPTDAENKLFAGVDVNKTTSAHWTAGNSADYAGNPGIGKFPLVNNAFANAFTYTLPAAGNRNYTTGAVSSQGTYGHYWSATPNSDIFGYRLSFDSGNVDVTHYNNYSNGFSVRCVRKMPPSAPVTPQEPYILYWDAAAKAMQVGSWNTKGGMVNFSNMLFFQFGSVVGFTNKDEWSTDGSDIMFNPTARTNATLGANFSTQIPNWGDYALNNNTAEGYISSAEYHNQANILAGLGDPCKLAGLTLTDIASGHIDNGKFRMQTALEIMESSYALVEGGVQTSGPSSFLPFAGYRHPTDGVVWEQGPENSVGRYWSSTPKDSDGGLRLHFRKPGDIVSAGEVEKATSESWNEYGIAIRCVLQSGYEPPIYAVSVSATAGGSVNTIGGAYNYGETIALAATPAPNHIFERWTTAGSVTVADAGSPLTTMTVNGPGIVTANFKSNSSPAMIIYWDSQTGTMQVGTWGIARQDNMLFFQFGSVVGFTNNNDGWGADKVKFNPPNGNYTTYGDIPRWNGTATTDGYISDPAYHNAANVQAGRGDPCKLVGFTAAEIAAGSYDNEQWRLPTEEENNADFGEGTTFVGDWGVAGHGIGKAGVCFLPAAGLRQQSNGSPSEVCQTGAYWTSKPEIGEFAQSLHFQEGNTLSPVYGLNPRYGLSVRCVPNDESPRQLIPRALILYFDADNLLSLGEWDNPAVNVSNMAFFKFGSVIGFHNRKTGDPNTGSVDWPGASAILFNPTKLVYGTDYADIPGYVSADYPKLVSSAEYATVANLMAGKGDPCMLVGYIGAQLQDMNENQLQAVLDNAAYRMPTNAENMEFAGTTELQSPFITHWTANDANATRPGVGKFPIVNNGIGTSYQHKLPAAGTRNHSTGAVVNQGLVAYYPSATPSDNNGYSYSLNFGATVVSPKNLAEYSIGTGIRCVLK